jgi:hypothetical protein
MLSIVVPLKYYKIMDLLTSSLQFTKIDVFWNWFNQKTFYQLRGIDIGKVYYETATA